MPKALCLTAMVISILVFLLFFSELALGFMGLTNLAPFRFANITIDIVFTVCAAILGFLSFLTFRDQV